MTPRRAIAVTVSLGVIALLAFLLPRRQEAIDDPPPLAGEDVPVEAVYGDSDVAIPARLASPPRPPTTVTAPSTPSPTPVPPAAEPPTMTLRVVVVDSESGLALPAARVEVFRPGSLYADVPPVPGRAAPEDVWLVPGLDGGAPVRIWPALSLTTRFRVATPDGFLAHESTDVSATLSAYARSLSYVYPLHREARVLVTAQLPSDAPADSPARVTASSFTTAADWVRVEPAGVGAWRVRGLPYFRGEPLCAGVAIQDVASGRGWGGNGTAAMARFPDQEAVVHVLFAPSEPPATGGGAGGSFRGRLAGSKRSDAGTASLEVHGLRRDGRPAAGARVRVVAADGTVRRLELDAEGRGRVEQLVAGRQVARLAEPGLVPGAAEVTLAEGQHAAVTVREPVGGQLEVTVVDREGLPAPFARVTIEQPSGAAWADLDADGVQRLDPYVDHLGRRSYLHVEAGDVRVKAAWASRKGERAATVGDGATTHVTVVVE
jgi:hypothetical protein